MIVDTIAPLKLDAWPGHILNIGCEVGGVELFLGYAASIAIEEGEVILKGGFTHSYFPAANGLAKMREPLPRKAGRFRVSRLLIQAQPIELWMGLSKEDYKPVWELLRSLDLEGFDDADGGIFEGDW